MADRNSSRTRSKRRFRPLRRALLLFLAGLLVFGLFRTATLTYSRAFGNKVQVVRATEVPLTPLFSGVGVMLRDEVVVVAPRPGTVNAMVQATADVAAGDEILEIVDRDRLAEIERLIAAEEAKQAGTGPDATVTLASAESALRQATHGLRELTSAYAVAIRQGEITQTASLFRDIARVAEQVDLYDNAYQLALGVSDEIGSRYEELLEQRATAIHKIVAPVSGVVTWVVDELSGSARPILPPAEVIALISDRNPAVAPLSSGVHVAGGSAMCAIVDPATITLAIHMVDVAWMPEVPIKVRINGKDVDADLHKSVTVADESALYYFNFMSISREVLDSRWVDVEIWPVREAMFSVPASSLTHVDGVSTIYAVDENNAVFAVTVEVREDNGTHIVVAGLNSSPWIVSTPELVTVGDTVTRPKGD